jgi:hypothetical protein
VSLCSVKDGLSKIAPFFSHCTLFNSTELWNTLLVNLEFQSPRKEHFVLQLQIDQNMLLWLMIALLDILSLIVIL